jgi:hypothetical protein
MILAIFHLFSYQPGFIVPGALLVLIVLILFFRPISLQCLALKKAISSLWLLSIACGICVLAIFISQWLNGFFPVQFSSEQSISLTKNMDIVFFVSVFVITTPFFSSLIVKHTANISRKSLLLFFFVVPNGLFWMIQSHDISIIDNNIIFLVMTIFFCRQFFSQKTTENFLTAALPLPKQRIYIPKNSLGLFTIHCLTIFTLYLLFSLDGIQAFSAITTCDGLLIIGLIMISIVSYFGKSYRNKLIASSTNL